MPRPKPRPGGGTRNAIFRTGRTGPDVQAKAIEAREIAKWDRWQEGVGAFDEKLERMRKRRHKFTSTPSGICSTCDLDVDARVDGRFLHTNDWLVG